MDYRPLAELYSSHRIPTAPFGIGKDEILPGSLQVQYQNLVGSLLGHRLCNYSLQSPWLYLLSITRPLLSIPRCCCCCLGLASGLGRGQHMSAQAVASSARIP